MREILFCVFPWHADLFVFICLLDLNSELQKQFWQNLSLWLVWTTWTAVTTLWFTGMMQRDNWPLFSALRYLTCSSMTKAYGPVLWQGSEFTNTGGNCYREQSIKVCNMMSRIWKNIIYICLGEYWLVLCLVLSSQDFFSLSPTLSCWLCCLSCRHRNIVFAFIPFFPGNIVGGKKKKSC